MLQRVIKFTKNHCTRRLIDIQLKIDRNDSNFALKASASEKQ